MSDDIPSLDTLEAAANHLAGAFESGDAGRIGAALQAVANAPALPELAAAAGYPRHDLAAALLTGELPLDMILGIMKVIDLHRTV